MAQGWRKDYSRYRGFFLNILDLYKTKPNLKIYLEIILSLTTIIVFSLFAIRPTVLTIIELNNEINNKRSLINTLKQKTNNLTRASTLLQSQSSNLNLINEAIPSNANLDIAINQIEKLASNHQLQILNIASTDLILSGESKKKAKASDVKAMAGDASELNLALSVSGSYENLLAFMVSLENLRRPLKIDSFTINSTNSANDDKLIVLTITGRLPFIKIITNNE